MLDAELGMLNDAKRCINSSPFRIPHSSFLINL